MLVTACTTPGHSWANPVKCVMPLLNFAIQNVAVIRELSDNKFHSYNTMADICALATAVLYLSKSLSIFSTGWYESQLEQLSLKDDHSLQRNIL